MIKCKITVLKRNFNKDYVEQYVQNQRKKTLGPCEVFQEGQEFITDVFSGIPQIICSRTVPEFCKRFVKRLPAYFFLNFLAKYFELAYS